MEADNSPEHSALLEDVKFGLNLLVVAFKNYALYPESNNIRRASLTKVYEWLIKFIAANENLLLAVSRDALLFRGEPVFRDKPGEQALVFPLFRDGVQWLEFTDGLTLEELETLVTLLGRFRVLKEEAEDDLVTAMWEAAFTNINYKTADEFWETDPLIDLNSLKVAREQAAESGWGSGAYGAGSGGGGMGAGESGIGGGLGGGIGGGAGQGGGYGREGQTAGRPDAPPKGSSSPGGTPGGQKGAGDQEESRAISLSREAFGGEVNTDYLTKKAGAAKIKPISELFTYADDAADDEPPVSGHLPLPSSSEGAVYFNPEDAAKAHEAVKLAAALASGRSEFFQFTPEEAERLAAMIALEEHRNSSKDGLDIILIVLKELANRIDKSPILDFMFQEIILILEQGNFFQVRTLAEKMYAMTAAGGPWLTELRNDFAARLAAPEVLAALKPIWQGPQPPEQTLAELRRLLLLLPPAAADVLAPVLAQKLPVGLEFLLLEAVAVELSQVRANPLALVGKMKSASVQGLLHAFRQLRLPFPEGLLAGLTRHESPVVREMAAKILVEENPDHLRSLFYLIEDPQISIQGWLCAMLGRQRNATAEKLIRDYLEEAYSEGKDLTRERVLNCYQTLGRCGSPQAVDFLEDILTKRAWKSIFGLDGSIHRLGAAMALMLMPPEWGAAEILNKAARSPFPAIRQACRQAADALQHS